MSWENTSRTAAFDSRKTPIRVLLAKPGLDVHDRGIKVVARALRDAGMEVIYLGLRQTSEEIVEAAVAEDVDAIGISNLSAAHTFFTRQIMDLLRKNDAADIIVVVGGTLLRKDIEALQAMGVAACFTPGTDTRDIIQFLESAVAKRRVTQSIATAGSMVQPQRRQ